MGEEAVGGCLGCSNHEVVEFKIFGDRKKTAMKTWTVDMGRADFRLCMELVSNIPQATAFETIEIHQWRSLSKYNSLRAQEQTIPKYQSQAGGAQDWLGLAGSSPRA